MHTAEVGAQVAQRFVEIDELTLPALYSLGPPSSLVHPGLLHILRNSAGHAIQDRLTQPTPIILGQGEGLIQDVLGRRGHEDSLGACGSGRYRLMGARRMRPLPKSRSLA